MACGVPVAARAVNAPLDASGLAGFVEVHRIARQWSDVATGSDRRFAPERHRMHDPYLPLCTSCTRSHERARAVQVVGLYRRIDGGVK